MVSHIYTNLQVNATVRLPHPRSGDSQGQETFLAPSADKQTRNYDTRVLYIYISRWPTKMSLFFFGNNLNKNKETFKIFSPQILEVYRIILVGTTLESIMFYYTFSVINTMFVPCTALLYESTAAIRTLKLSTILLSISCGICLISLPMISLFVFGLFSQTLSLRYPLRK